jgi:Zn-dependent peptidase ImmA (M78 family)
MMSRFVPYLSEDAIERDAASLLAEFAQARHLTPPIPIEDIIEKHLKLTFEFDDTHLLFGIPRDPGRDTDILGAMLFDEHRIVIDESLDPYDNPFKEREFRYTVAHECAHYRLHRPLFVRDPGRPFLFGGPPPSVICSSNQTQERIEWQADHWACSVLMPRNSLLNAWNEWFGNSNPHIWRRKNLSVLAVVNDELTTVFRLFDRRGHDEAIRRFSRERDDEALNEFVAPFADKFQVPVFRMRIRLEQIGLLYRSWPTHIHRRASESFLEENLKCC